MILKKYNVSRVVAIILVLVMMFTSACISVSAEVVAFDDSNVLTDTLLLVDTDSGQVLYSKNSDLKRPMASTVKIMTCILALENISDLDEKIKITKEPINDIMNMGAATAGFENHVGESFSARDIIHGVLLPSGCEAAQILAYYVGGTPENFAKMMNEKAQELGCKDTYFVEGHGLSDENYTTANDMVKIAKYALSNPEFAKIVSTEYYTASGYSYPFINTNYLIDVKNGREYYYKYATGVKTGYTDASGKCLVSTAKKGDDEFMCVALGAPYPANDGYINHAMTDSVDLYEWAFENYTDNIEVDFKNDYASVEIGKTLKLNATVEDNNAVIQWSSSDETVATVDQNGVVTAHSLGQAMITAKTPTGNFDVVNVSCGFYNGIDVTSRYGDYTTGSKNPINWQTVKENGFDFAVIRAGWGWEDYPYQNDAQFVNNVKGAYSNNIPFYLSFIGYAQNADEAKLEAEYFLKEMANDFPAECKDGLLSVVYNMTDSSYSSNSKEVNTEVALSFAKELKENGYKTVVFANKSVFSKLDTDLLTSNSVGTYYSYYPYDFDFSTPITTPDGKTPQMWQYRGDGYVPNASDNLNTKQCIVYMLDTFSDNISAPQLNCQLTANDTVKFSWTPNDVPVDAYEIYQIDDNGESTLIKQLSGDTTTFEYICDTAGLYKFVVKKIVADAINGNTAQFESNVVEIQTYDLMDADRSGDVNIIDATMVQMFVAKYKVDSVTDISADVDKDGFVTILDATAIQMRVSKLA